MKDYISELLQRAIELENNEKPVEALKLYLKALNLADQKGPILYEIACFFFKIGEYKEAFQYFVDCHKEGFNNDQIESILIEGYYIPNKEEYKKQYDKNVSMLLNYQHIIRNKFPSFDNLNKKLIPCNDAEFYIFDVKLKTFEGYYSLNNDLSYANNNLKEKEIVIIKNEYNIDRILDIEYKIRDKKPYKWMKIPLYLYYDSFEDFIKILPVVDLEKLLGTERVVFLFGKDDLRMLSEDVQTMLPQRILNVNNKEDDIVKELKKIIVGRSKLINKNIEELNNYYKENKLQIVENIKKGKPKILFVTSRFTTAVQYYTRDCILACECLEIENRLIIERSDIHRCINDWIIQINNFKPDIIFIIDHFRWEYSFIPKDVVSVSWAQDLLPNIFNKESAKKIDEKEFVLNAFITSKEFLGLGYPKDKLIDAPFPVNEKIYKSYNVSNQEKRKYGADVCIFSNVGDPQEGLNIFINMCIRPIKFKEKALQDDIIIALKLVFREVYSRIYKGENIYSINDYMKILSKHMKKLDISEKYLKIFAREFRNYVGYRIMRSVPIEWLHEKGIYSIKLWGREWVNHPKLSQYAMGVAQNGETLSRIINSCKIILGTNQNVTAHPRVYESILSGTFYIAPNIPEEHDFANIRKYMVENDEIVFFYSREDLYNKVDYYLENKSERDKIIDNGKKKILKKLTYKKLMERMIKEIGKRL